MPHPVGSEHATYSVYVSWHFTLSPYNKSAERNQILWQYFSLQKQRITVCVPYQRKVSIAYFRICNNRSQISPICKFNCPKHVSSIFKDNRRDLCDRKRNVKKCSSFFLRNWFWLVVKYRTQEVFVSSSFLCNPFGLNYIASMLLFIYCFPVFYPAITQKMSQRLLSITVWKQFGDVTTKILINQSLTLKVEK